MNGDGSLYLTACSAPKRRAVPNIQRMIFALRRKSPPSIPRVSAVPFIKKSFAPRMTKEISLLYLKRIDPSTSLRNVTRKSLPIVFWACFHTVYGILVVSLVGSHFLALLQVNAMGFVKLMQKIA